jgi:aspartate-semialdehyde dehydrogenase
MQRQLSRHGVAPKATKPLNRCRRSTVPAIRAAKTADGPRLAIVGITGAVGQEFLTVLKERNFPYSEIKLLASARSAGKKQEFEGVEYTIEELTENSFGNVDIALFSAGGSISKKFGPLAAEKGCVVVDNSSAFRMTDGVPLVIPEVNPDAMAGVKIGKGGIIANPNCSTIIALMAVTPLHRIATVKRMIVSTYQAASGAGAAAMEELLTQTRDVLDGKPAQPQIFPCQYAFNLFSHNSPMIVDVGYNEEELKMVKETKKIWQNAEVKITATCIRVPVMRAHAESINLEFENEITEQQARDALASFPGVEVLDDRANNRFPMPLDATTQDDVYVGRIRRDISRDDNKGLELFVCGDQIKKGAALNAVQIAELLL